MRSRIGRSWGRVMETKRRIGPAPSTFAASYSSWGMPCRPHEVDHRVVAGVVPGDDEDDADAGPEGAAEPVHLVDAEQGEDPVQQSGVAVEDHGEHHARGDQTGQRGDEDAEPPERAQPDLGGVEAEGDEQGEAEHQRHLDDQDQRGVLQRGPEQRVVQQALVVVEPGEVPTGAVAGGEADPERGDDGVRLEDRETQHGGHDQQVRDGGAGQQLGCRPGPVRPVRSVVPRPGRGGGGGSVFGRGEGHGGQTACCRPVCWASCSAAFLRASAGSAPFSST